MKRPHFAKLFIFSWLCLLSLHAAKADDASRLAKQLEPWLQLMSGKLEQFTLTGSGSPIIDGKPQKIELKLVRFDAESFDLELEHPEYAVHLRRRAGGIAFCVPKHKAVFLGSGVINTEDHLQPAGILNRLVSNGTTVRTVTQLVTGANASDVAGALQALTKIQYLPDDQAWKIDDVQVKFSTDGRQATGKVDDTTFELKFDAKVDTPRAYDDWPEMKARQLDRGELEKQLARGVRRAMEVFAPSALLTKPAERAKKVDHGELRWVDGHRVVLLSGTPEEIGEAHGKLLKQEANRCIDSVMYAFGTAQTIVTGRWFRDDLDAAYAKLAKHIPERHKVETRAMAESLGLDKDLVEALNVFPEMFHCSGFALFGKATKDGKLYHGRVLDYMTEIGLQDAATTFIVAPEGMIPFANVGYAGFIGSVSGMNAEKISLGEMGGRGEGQWDGVPMATLMRRGLEECSSLAQVKDLWKNNPRTCEYYYVFADGEDRSAVGVAATPDKLQFVAPGEGHELLGDGIEDAVVLSAGTRLEELRKRVKTGYGKFDADSAQGLMCRPVAMESNLHNVLFVPEDGVLYVANADHKQPAAERPYVKLDLIDLLKQMPSQVAGKLTTNDAKLSTDSRFAAIDTLNLGDEPRVDAKKCLDGLKWNPSDFSVIIETAKEDCGDWLVRFPSAKPSGNELNDRVAMEWYQAKDKAGQPIEAPAAVIVHESGSGMTVGRIVARSLRSQGIHTFMMQLPYYGVRRGPEGRPSGTNLVGALQQGIADARRAKDAVAAMPLVDKSRISLQGTSLGGFVTATTAGLDNAYHRTFVLLAGGDLYGTLMSGKKDAEKVRAELTKTGLSNDEVHQMLDSIEPLRLAHRVDPSRTWLFSGKYDDVVPPRSAQLFAEATRIDASHHVEMLANHYSGIIFLPVVTKQMCEIMCEPAE
ncbi:MAG: C45 family autoproteolytic acyltransferase/hydrolase [Pirellulaceae bacterium]|nr:C45 family autoproteolytic acyltransferase/hydrolase [Pirellulaceae bacterium]